MGIIFLESWPQKGKTLSEINLSKNNFFPAEEQRLFINESLAFSTKEGTVNWTVFNSKYCVAICTGSSSFLLQNMDM